MNWMQRRVRTFVWVGLPIIAIAGLYFGLRDGRAAWDAHRGVGTTGTFAVRRQMCRPSGDDCTTYGDFKATAGGATREDVVLYGAPKTVKHDEEYAALDSGAPYGVFPADGGSEYVVYTIFLSAGTAAAIAWILFLVTRFRRRKNARVNSEGLSLTNPVNG